ncbi:MAG: CidA/LrgA family protein [Eubacteriales bacterium]
MKMMYQIGLLFGVCLLGQAISVYFPIPFPGSVLSMIILFLLLFFRVVKVDHIRQKADFLLKNMSFFFIPAGIGILSSFDLIRSSILPLITVIIVTTILTFGATALTVQGIITLQDRHAKAKKAKEKSHE